MSDDACIPTLRGPGPIGGGGRRSKPGHDVIHLRGRFPQNALTGNRSSGIVVDDIQIHALSMVGSELNLDDAKSVARSARSARPSIRFSEYDTEGYGHAPSRSRSRLDVPNPDASSSEAYLFRPVNWRNDSEY